MVTWRQGVVVGVDGSEEAYRALDWAAAAADRHAASLTVVGTYAVGLVAVPVGGVLDTAPLHGGAEHVVARAASRLGSRRPGGYDVATDVALGAAAHVLVQRSRTADLVVVGRRGLGAVDRVLAGSVSSAVAAMAHGKVAVVPASAVGTTPRRVVVGVDVEDPGPELEAAFDEAAQLGAGVEVVHAVDPDLLGETLAVYEGWGDAWRAQADDAVRAGVSRWAERYPWVPVTTRVENGRPAEALLRSLRPDDLVVVGGRSHRRAVGRLLRSAPCAVLVVHPA